MCDDPRFVELKRRLKVFIFPMSIAFFAWYLLYVLMSAFARDTMAIVLFGSVNVALVFGLLQFATTFGIAFFYARYAARRLDPLAEELRAELNNAGVGAVAAHGPAENLADDLSDAGPAPSGMKGAEE
ncbi:Clumping factor B [Nocardiopsis rhodophaea]